MKSAGPRPHTISKDGVGGSAHMKIITTEAMRTHKQLHPHAHGAGHSRSIHHSIRQMRGSHASTPTCIQLTSPEQRATTPFCTTQMRGRSTRSVAALYDEGPDVRRTRCRVDKCNTMLERCPWCTQTPSPIAVSTQTVTRIIMHVHTHERASDSQRNGTLNTYGGKHPVQPNLSTRNRKR